MTLACNAAGRQDRRGLVDESPVAVADEKQIGERRSL